MSDTNEIDPFAAPAAPVEDEPVVVALEFKLDRIGLMACARYARLTGAPLNKVLAAQATREAIQMEGELARAKHEQAKREQH